MQGFHGKNLHARKHGLLAVTVTMSILNQTMGSPKKEKKKQIACCTIHIAQSRKLVFEYAASLKISLEYLTQRLVRSGITEGFRMPQLLQRRLCRKHGSWRPCNFTSW